MFLLDKMEKEYEIVKDDKGNRIAYSGDIYLIDITRFKKYLKESISKKCKKSRIVTQKDVQGAVLDQRESGDLSDLINSIIAANVELRKDRNYKHFKTTKNYKYIGRL